MYVYVPCASLVPAEPKEGIESLGTVATDPLYACLELNLGHLEEHFVLAELSLTPTRALFEEEWARAFVNPGKPNTCSTVQD